MNTQHANTPPQPLIFNPEASTIQALMAGHTVPENHPDMGLAISEADQRAFDQITEGFTPTVDGLLEAPQMPAEVSEVAPTPTKLMRLRKLGGMAVNKVVSAARGVKEASKNAFDKLNNMLLVGGSESNSKLTNLALKYGAAAVSLAGGLAAKRGLDALDTSTFSGGGAHVSPAFEHTNSGDYSESDHTTTANVKLVSNEMTINDTDTPEAAGVNTTGNVEDESGGGDIANQSSDSATETNYTGSAQEGIEGTGSGPDGAEFTPVHLSYEDVERRLKGIEDIFDFDRNHDDSKSPSSGPAKAGVEGNGKGPDGGELKPVEGSPAHEEEVITKHLTDDAEAAADINARTVPLQGERGLWGTGEDYLKTRGFKATEEQTALLKNLLLQREGETEASARHMHAQNILMPTDAEIKKLFEDNDAL